MHNPCQPAAACIRCIMVHQGHLFLGQSPPPCVSCPCRREPAPLCIGLQACCLETQRHRLQSGPAGSPLSTAAGPTSCMHSMPIGKASSRVAVMGGLSCIALLGCCGVLHAALCGFCAVSVPVTWTADAAAPLRCRAGSGGGEGRLRCPLNHGMPACGTPQSNDFPSSGLAWALGRIGCYGAAFDFAVLCAGSGQGPHGWLVLGAAVFWPWPWPRSWGGPGGVQARRHSTS
jgi:hypothetical protein